MALLKPGYWQSTYWPSAYWHEDYWQDYALSNLQYPIRLFKALAGSARIFIAFNEIIFKALKKMDFKAKQ